MSRSQQSGKPRRLWYLVDVMKARNVRSAWELQVLLAPYIELSYYRVRRLINGNFSVSLETLDALCYVLRCHISDLVRIDYRENETSMENPAEKKQNRRYKTDRPARVRRLKPLGDPSNVPAFTMDLSAFLRTEAPVRDESSDVVAGNVDLDHTVQNNAAT